jgi:hypothetical protein
MDKFVKYALSFDKMVSPLIIKVVYFLLLAVVIISGVLGILSSFWALFHGEFLTFLGGLFTGILLLVLGCVGVRVYCELLILAFRIYDNLVEINQSLKKNNPPAPAPAPASQP